MVDDHALIRRGLRHLFEREPHLTVCGEAENIAESMAKIKESHPDLLIVDISLPDGSGLDLIKRVLAVFPEMPILVSSMHDERLLAERVLLAGAKGYINKQEAGEFLVAAVTKVLSGKVYLSQVMTERLLEQNYATNSTNASEVARSPIETLTNRELEVFEQIGKGLSTVKIAENLNLSVKTIETHRAHIKEKLGLNNSSELLLRAVQWALIG